MKERTHRIMGRRRGILVLAAAFVLAWAGCVSLQPSAAQPTPVARVAVANLTNYTWEIAVRSAAGEVRVERVEPRRIAQWTLAGGDYVIEQALAGQVVSQPVRRFAARFVAGVDYNWSLATVNSVAPNDAALAAR